MSVTVITLYRVCTTPLPPQSLTTPIPPYQLRTPIPPIAPPIQPERVTLQISGKQNRVKLLRVVSLP